MFKALPSLVAMNLFCKPVAILWAALKLGAHAVDVSVAAVITPIRL